MYMWMHHEVPVLYVTRLYDELYSYLTRVQFFSLDFVTRTPIQNVMFRDIVTYRVRSSSGRAVLRCFRH